MWPFTRKREADDEEFGPVGMSYDTWWNTLGRDAGMPYNPMSEAESAAADARVAKYTREYVTSGFFYDKDLAQFGNAVSPFVEMTHEEAHLAEQRRFEDRYDPKYFGFDDGMGAIAAITENYFERERPLPTTFFGSRECWARPGMLGLSTYQETPDMVRVPCPHESAAQAERTQGWFAPQDTYVGWAQPPHPIDVIPSFDPRASKRDQARAVLMDYYHDDPLRYWADNEAVKRCFGVKAKEDYDPALLVEAYENKSHKVWSCKGDKNTWKDLDDAVQQAIAHRTKLGPLPKSSYGEDGSDPLVIYYYDNDRMKRISYPRASIPAALNPNNVWWWKWGQGPGDDASKKKGLDDIHTNESNDPKAIAAERKSPGYPGGGNWGNEGIAWDKDMIGVMGPLVGAVLAIVSAVLDMTGVGAAIGVPLAIATPFIVAAINATDTALHAGDFGAAASNLAQALIAASANALSKGANIQIPPEATKALGTTVAVIGKAIEAGQKKNLDFGQLWEAVAKKAGSFTKIGDNEAHTIAVMLGENAAGNVFIHGYEAGKLTDPKTIGAIAKIMEAMKQFSDPRVINIFLLGAGIGYVAKQQALQAPAAPAPKPSGKARARRTPQRRAPAAHLTQGDFHMGAAQDRLDAFVLGQLLPRYGLAPSSNRGFVGTLVGAPQSDPLLVAIQTLLNELWGFAVGSLGYIRPTGVMTPHTKELIQSFQQNYNVPPGDGTPNVETARALEAAVAEKLQLIQHASAAQGAHAASGDYYVGDPPPPPEPDWGPLARGCPRGTWWDSLRSECRPVQPPPTHAVEGGAAHTLGFYAPRSEGAMVDLMLALQNDAGIPMTGAMPKWIARAYGVVFSILWDGPDESVRVAVLDADHPDLAAFWQHINALMVR